MIFFDFFDFFFIADILKEHDELKVLHNESIHLNAQNSHRHANIYNQVANLNQCGACKYVWYRFDIFVV